MSDFEEKEKVHRLLDAVWSNLENMENWHDWLDDEGDDFYVKYAEDYVETTEPKTLVMYLYYLLKSNHHFMELLELYRCSRCGHTAEEIPRPCPCLSEEMEPPTEEPEKEAV